MHTLQIPLKFINNYGDGFNIEGCDLLDYNNKPYQKWLNMCIVLDRPFIDQITLDEITKANKYTMKEASILNYNEFNVNLAILLITDYYKNQNNSNMIIQIHRASSGIKYINFFTTILSNHYNKQIYCITNENNITKVHFINGFILGLTYGYSRSTLKSYVEYNIVFSLSLMGGLSPKYDTSTMTFPTLFRHFDTKTNIIDCTKTRRVDNQLVHHIKDIINCDQTEFIKTVSQFKSENPNKQLIPKPLVIDDFKYDDITVLQIDDLYNPTVQMFNNPITIREFRSML